RVAVVCMQMRMFEGVGERGAVRQEGRDWRPLPRFCRASIPASHFSCQQRTVGAMTEDVTDRDESSALAATVQEVIQSVAASREGHAPDEIFVALKAELAKRALTLEIPNEALRTFAAAIAEGRQVSVDPNDLVGQT